MNVLHITAHLGGGVGRAISALIAGETMHTHCVLCMEPPIKSQFVSHCVALGTEVIITPTQAQLWQQLRQCDVVILHWWAHPIMAGVLAHFPDIPVRLVFWCHISGCSYPMLPFCLLDKAQRIFFTSPYSYENPEWSAIELTRIWGKSRILYGCGLLPKTDHRQNYELCGRRYRIGYAGTFARSKLHPGFVKACQSILDELPDTEFLLAGDTEDGKWILEEAQNLGISEHIKFQGYLLNMEAFWTQCDVFGYPLNPQHFGTTENVVLEAMASGLPVVLLNQAAEKYILSDPSTGVLADGLPGYITEIVSLYRDQAKRKSLGLNASAYVYKKYNHTKMVQAFQSELKHLLTFPKATVQFQDVLGDTPFHWLLSAMPSWMQKQCSHLVCGGMSEPEEQQWIVHCPYILKEPSKSSILHFARTFPQDKALHKLELSLNQYG